MTTQWNNYLIQRTINHRYWQLKHSNAWKIASPACSESLSSTAENVFSAARMSVAAMSRVMHAPSAARCTAPPALSAHARRAVGGSRNGGLSSDLHRTPGHRVLGGHERRFRLLSNRVSRPPHGIALMAPHRSSLVYLNKIRKLCEAEKIGSIGHKISGLNRNNREGRKRGRSTVQ